MRPDIKRFISAKFKSAREGQGLSIQEFATKYNFSRNWVWKVENAQSGLNKETIRKFCVALDINFDELMLEISNPKSEKISDSFSEYGNQKVTKFSEALIALLGADLAETIALEIIQKTRRKK